ncbi:MAG: S8 family serine peptidase [Pseudomonadota bacterium]|nr:S8 family serine peptidase [Pseudomonadota bacterium]
MAQSDRMPLSTSAAAAQCNASDAGDRLECQNRLFANYQFKLELRPQAVSSTATGPVVAADETGQLGDPDSWRTDEFEQDWGLGAINAHHAYARGLSGEGIRIGLLDSGAGLEHTEFAGKDHRGLTIGDLLEDGSRCAANSYLVGDSTCFGTDGGRPSINASYWDPTLEPYLREEFKYLLGTIELEYESHGTHVAGTMSANRDGQGMHGVAFNSTFNSARLFADTYIHIDLLCAFLGWCSSASMNPSDSAFEDMYQQMNADNVRALNHSWGLGREPTDAAGQDAFYNNPANASRWELMRDGSLANGMIQVWAAGNTGSVIATPAESPIAGIYASLPRLYAELEPYWLSVVNVGRTGDDDNPYVLSNRSMKCGLSMNWCLAAPGSVINSTVYGGSSLEGDIGQDADGNFYIEGIDTLNPEFNYANYSGTSMAAPHVTGALALLFERYPYLTNPQVRDVMLTTATDMGAPGVDEIYGWGLLNLQKAIEGYGQFRVDTDVVMNHKAGGTHVWNDSRVWDDWRNDIGGPGRLSFDSGNGGWLRLSGSNTFNGLTVKGGVLELAGDNQLAADVVVNGGVLNISSNGVLNGSMLTINDGAALINGRVVNGETLVNAAGYLRGTGSLGNTTVYGTVAPGNSIGTLTINGDYVQKAGSYFDVEMQPPSSTDMIDVTGTAVLEGGTVRAIRMPGVFGLGQTYSILNAAGGISGQFAGVDVSGLSPFLAMNLRYGSNTVFADMIRGASLASVATTPNQIATAGALDSLADSNALLQALVLLPDADQANSALNQLSGELYPTLRGVLVDDGRHLRGAALARARTGHDAFTAQSAGEGFSLWADLLSNGGSLQGDANSAYARYSGYQALVGADYQLDSGWRFGALGGTGRTDANIGLRDSKAEVRNRMAGLYLGQRWGGFGVQAGYTRAWHDIENKRGIAFAGFSDQLMSRHDATTDQAFIEGGYLFGGQAWQIEPYLQYAHVKVKADGFSETGGAAALNGGAETSKVNLATGGLRFNVNLRGAQQEETWLSLRGGLAYRHASSDITAANTLQFTGSNGYTVQGAPIADRATIGELGIAARLSDRTMLELGYSGQFADEGNDHGANTRLTIKF